MCIVNILIFRSGGGGGGQEKVVMVVVVVVVVVEEEESELHYICYRIVKMEVYNRKEVKDIDNVFGLIKGWEQPGESTT